MSHFEPLLQADLGVSTISESHRHHFASTTAESLPRHDRALDGSETQGFISYDRLKRIFDLVLAVGGLIVLSPLFLVVGLLIKLRDRGPILYVQDRVGKDGQLFRFYKFRSMVVNADKIQEQLLAQNQHGGDTRTFKMKRDPRITPIGRLIRRTSIDELPQLWNVIRGDMSIVGPRPPLPKEVELYSERDWRRLEVIPGLTCYWQISGRSNLSFEQQVELDIRYIESRTLLEDFRIVVRTIPAVVFGWGAY